MKAAVTLLLGLALALVASELVVRAGRLDRFQLRLRLLPGESLAMRYDDQLGWANLAGGSNNGQGFRHPREYTRRKQLAGRIAIVGDSQVFGLWVQHDEHIGAVLDRRLEDVEVYSFGVPGYGPAQELLLLKDVLEHFELDAAVVVPFLENDLIDATLMMAYGGLQKPYLKKQTEGWRVTNVPVPLPVLTSRGGAEGSFFRRAPRCLFLHPRLSLYAVSSLYRAIARRSSALPGLGRALDAADLAELTWVEATVGAAWSLRRADGAPVPCSLLADCPREHWLDGLDATVAAYLEMQRLCERHGVAFAVLSGPSQTELELGSFPALEALSKALARENIPEIRLLESFLDMGAWNRVVGAAPDRHWTPLGHRIAAEAVERYWHASRAAS